MSERSPPEADQMSDRSPPEADHMNVFNFIKQPSIPSHNAVSPVSLRNTKTYVVYCPNVDKLRFAVLIDGYNWSLRSLLLQA